MYKINLLVQLADSIVKQMYRITIPLQFKYQSSIGDQLRRSSLSICLNIVEANARFHNKEKKQLLNISYASLKESLYLLQFACELGLVSSEKIISIRKEADRLGGLLYGIIHQKTKLYSTNNE